MKECVIESCLSNFDPSLQSTVTFFDFPETEDAERFVKWTVALNKQPEYFKHHGRLICSRHFLEEDFDQSSFLKSKEIPDVKSNLKLLKQAVPSLHLFDDDSLLDFHPVFSVKTEFQCNGYTKDNRNNVKFEPDVHQKECIEDEKMDVVIRNGSLLGDSLIKPQVQNDNQSKTIMTVEEKEIDGDDSQDNHDKRLIIEEEEVNENKNQILDSENDKDLKTQNGNVDSTGDVNNLDVCLEKKFSCSDCGEKFAWAKEVKKHKLVTHGSFQCKLCRKRFVHMSNLKTHKKEKHAIFYVYNCDICDEAFFSVKGLDAHLKVHKEIRMKKCRNCKKSFPCNHFKSHKCVLPRNSYECNICQRIYKSESNLFNHQQKVHKVVIFKKDRGKCNKCDICGKVSNCLKSLKSHLLTHQDTYKCDICNRRCSGSDALKFHKLSHKGVECFNIGRVKHLI